MATEREVYPKLHAQLVDSFHKGQPVDTWGNPGHEFKILRKMEEKLIGLYGTEDEAIKEGVELLRTFWRKRRKETTAYWTECKFTPAGLMIRWDDLIAVQTAPGSTRDLTRAGSEAVADFLEAVQVTYERSYNQDMADAIARMFGDAPKQFLSALLDAVVGSFTPTAARPLPDPAAMNLARATLKPANEYVDQTALLQLPAACPFCGHPVRKISATEAMCLGEYVEALHRKAGCGAEWEKFTEGWRQGFWRTVGNGELRRSVWEDGPPPDLNTNWRAEVSKGVPAMNHGAMIEDGRKAEYLRVNREVDGGAATQAETDWIQNYGKPRKRLPGIKHVSDTVEAEERW